MMISAGLAPVWAQDHRADLREAACLARQANRARRAPRVKRDH
jgi:endonuclease YncB( thermonuclease family)